MYTFLWKVENLSMHFRNHKDCIKSHVFNYKNCLNSMWQLYFYPRGIGNKNPDVCIFLYLIKSNGAKRIKLKYKFEILDNSDRILACRHFKNTFTVGQRHGSLNLFNYDKDNKWKDVITIRCELISSDAVEDGSYGCGSKALTRIGCDKIEFNWNLELPETPEWTHFRMLSFETMVIKIILKVDGENVQINIYKIGGALNTSKPKVIVCKFSLLDVKNMETVSKQDTYSFRTDRNVDFWEFPSFFTKEQLQERKETYLKGNIFTLKCEICCFKDETLYHIEECVFHPSDKRHAKSQFSEFSSLQIDLRKLLLDKKHCDVEFVVGGETIKAHKTILVARSPVFSAMFSHDMKEKNTGIINITDIDATTLRLFLEFFYTGYIEDLSYKSASELLMMADKYTVSSLIELCSKFLISVLTENNACYVLTKADMFRCEFLRASAMDYIVANFDVILQTESWRTFKHNLDLVKELMQILET